MKRRLVVFARAPQLGRVKQRLARGIGSSAALAFYRRTLTAVLRRVGHDPRWQTVLAVTPDRTARIGRLWPVNFVRACQGRGDLGVRMARSLRRRRGGLVCIVGADIPDLDTSHVWRAFRALAAADLVFGPAADGGYWLVGARGPLPYALFTQVRWSTSHALADTLAPLKGRRVALVDRLADVDDEAAYRARTSRRRGGGPGRGSRDRARTSRSGRAN